MEKLNHVEWGQQVVLFGPCSWLCSLCDHTQFHIQKVPSLFKICYCKIEILSNFEQGASFYFLIQGLINYIAGPSVRGSVLY